MSYDYRVAIEQTTEGWMTNGDSLRERGMSIQIIDRDYTPRRPYQNKFI
jgi:hypothetical protein